MERLIRTGRRASVLASVLLLYVAVAGLMLPVPPLDILQESIRNLYFHVPLWFGMLALLTVAMIASIRQLRYGDELSDRVAAESTHVALLFGVLGIATGMIWARYTWGDWWSSDPKQNAAAAALLLYAAYFVLRSAFDHQGRRNRLSAVFNILAFAIYIPLIYVLPRMTASLHPGAGGNPAFGRYDLDATMRQVFYPAVLGYIALGWWMVTLRLRLARLEAASKGV